MSIQRKIRSILNWVAGCIFCQPLSGCILSEVKGKDKHERKTYLNGLSEEDLDRSISYHEHCPYRHRLPK